MYRFLWPILAMISLGSLSTNIDLQEGIKSSLLFEIDGPKRLLQTKLSELKINCKNNSIQSSFGFIRGK